jgi:antitoxin component YwqK of YwqJK toxin-antitoxin module
MKTLKEIYEKAIQHKPCGSQITQFKKAIDAGEELRAWQMLLGNIIWLRDNNIEIDILELYERAHNVGCTWYNNGQLSAEYNYKEGKRDGISCGWYPSGQLLSECNYKEGKRDGICREWYASGQLEFERNYKEGKRDGIRRRWYANGQLLSECNYKAGILI